MEETISLIETDGSEAQRDALNEFRSRLKAGRIPDPVPDSAVAEFIGGEYATHRF